MVAAIVILSLVGAGVWKSIEHFKGIIIPNKRVHAAVIKTAIVKPFPWNTDDDRTIDHYFQVVKTYSYRFSGHDYSCNLTLSTHFYHYERAVNASIEAVGEHSSLWVIPRHPTNCNGMSLKKRQHKLEFTCLMVFMACSLALLCSCSYWEKRKEFVEEKQTLEYQIELLNIPANENLEHILK